MVTALTDHYVPATMKWTERYKLNCRNKKLEENCNEFAAALRRLAKQCMYGAHLDEALTLRFICGIKSESIRKRLLLTEKDTFKEVVEVACKCENAERHSELMGANYSGNPAPVLKLHHGSPSRRGRSNPGGNRNYVGGSTWRNTWSGPGLRSPEVRSL